MAPSVTADDVLLTVASAVYDPSTNVDVSNGAEYPVAVRQTITLAFADALPSGAYRVEVLSTVQTASFNESELDLLTDAAFEGHPVVSRLRGQVVNGSVRLAPGLVNVAEALGDLGVWENGTSFFTQLHGDLGALLDGRLTELGDDASIPARLNAEIQRRFEAGLGSPSERPTGVLVIWLDRDGSRHDKTKKN